MASARPASSPTEANGARLRLFCRISGASTDRKLREWCLGIKKDELGGERRTGSSHSSLA